MTESPTPPPPEHEADLQTHVPVDITPMPEGVPEEVKPIVRDFMRSNAVEQAANTRTILDLKNQVSASEQGREKERIDVVTGLPTRKQFEEDLAKVLDRNGRRIGALVIDADGLHRLNHSDMGWAGGDRLLRTLAESTKKQIRTLDKVYRIGGDEFAVILESFNIEDDPEKIEEYLLRMEQGFDEDLAKEDFPPELKLGASAGVAIREGQETSDQLLDRAMKIMDARKKARYRAHGVKFADERELPPPDDEATPELSKVIG